MVELTASSALQPCLLDRLRDDDPGHRTEASDRQVLSLAQFRDTVRRDLGFLLNTTHLSTVQNLSGYPFVDTSVLNFGIPDLAGRPVSAINASDLARSVHRAILLFEPRLLENSLRVSVAIGDADRDPKALHFDVVGDLWCQPTPVRLRFRAELNLEDGEARVLEATPG
ncbi:MAG: type VI secretion system baseplate subunit TssE [Polyangiaceae bacterium]